VKTFFRLLALFMAMPVVELALLLQVSRWIGFWPTVALIIATAVAGSYLAKREGLSAWNRLQGSLSDGGLPGDEILDAVIVLIAGAFLITPGVLTDLIGFSGLVPLTRGWIRRLAKRRLKKAAREGRIQASFGVFGPGGAHAPGGSGSPPGAPPDPTGADASSAPDGAEIGGSPSPRGPTAQDNAASDDGGRSRYLEDPSGDGRGERSQSGHSQTEP
jgi:UPF0716 protein FxsA